jgi:hypothetical protein
MKNGLQSMKRIVFGALFGLMAGSVIPATAKHFDYHWNHDGESHYLVGEAMGRAMLDLLKSR